MIIVADTTPLISLMKFAYEAKILNTQEIKSAVNLLRNTNRHISK